MALAASTVWEVRPTAGADTNGGGFVPGSSGTDWTQQNGTQYALTNGTTNGTTTVATASAVADMVGNIAYIAGGTGSITGAWYQIVSQITGVSITVDRSTGLTAGTGVTINIGGALATVSQGFTSAVACNTLWVKASGTYTAAATITTSLQSGQNGSNGTAFQVIGYTTTRGDNGQFTWTTSTNSVNLVTFSYSAGYGAGFVFRNIKFTCTAGTPGNGLYIANNGGRVTNLSVVNCYFSGFAVGISALNYGNTNDLGEIIVENTEITACTGYGMSNTVALMIGCYLHGNAGGGVNLWNSSDPVQAMVLLRCTIYNNTGYGLYIQGNEPGCQVVVINCNFVSNTNNGLDFSQNNYIGIGQLFVSNSIFVSNGGYGIASALTTGGDGSLCTFIGLYNAFYNNTNGNYQSLSAQASDIALTGSPFNSPSGGDFSLNGTAGMGAACKAAGYQGTLAGAVGGTTSAAIDLGAVQSASSGGGGGPVTNYIVAPTRTVVFVEDGY